MMDTTKPTVAEDPMVATEDIFGDLHLEGQHTDMVFPEAAKGKGDKLGETTAKELPRTETKRRRRMSRRASLRNIPLPQWR